MRCLVPLVLSWLFACSVHATQSSSVVVAPGKIAVAGGVLSVPPAIKAALDKSFPGFEHWNAVDYREQHRVPPPAQRAKGLIAPFAIVVDMNQDGREDLIVDGYMGSRMVLVCVISHQAGYVANDAFSSDKLTPLDHYLEVGTPRKANRSPVFSRNLDQQYEGEQYGLDFLLLQGRRGEPLCLVDDTED